MNFSDKKLGVCVCKHIFQSERIVTYIERFEDGMYSLSCGENDHSDNDDAEGEFFWVHIEHVLEADSSVADVPLLEPGSAFEKINSSWKKVKL